MTADASSLRFAPAAPVQSRQAADWIFETDAHVFARMHEGDMEVMRRHLAIQWEAGSGLHSHAHCIAAWRGETMIGIAIGYDARVQEKELPDHISNAMQALDPQLFGRMLSWWNDYGSFVQPEVPEDAWYLFNLAVAEDERNKGVGAALIEATFEAARKARRRRVHLDVAGDNPAVRLYERLGFETIIETRVPPLEADGIPTHYRMEAML